MKTGTITQIHSVREWTGGQHGPLYFHKLTLDNGDSGDLAKKARDAVKVGDTISYTLETDSRGNRIKETRPQAFQSGVRRQYGGSHGSTASFALSYAKDLAIANLGKTDKPVDMEALATRVIATAEKFNDWLRENG